MDVVYTAVCGNYDSINISVHARSPPKRPSAPQFTVFREPDGVVCFKCVSEGNPRPTILWYNDNSRISEGPEDERGTKNQTRSKLKCETDTKSNIKCCAQNSEGEECSQSYNYELGKSMQDKEASQIHLTSGHSLLLRCKQDTRSQLMWYFNNTKLAGITMPYFGTRMQFYNVESVSLKHSGQYYCMSEDGKEKKTTQVQVLEQDLIEVLKLDSDVRILYNEKADFCFKAQVLSHPKAQCHWITSNGTKVQCVETQYHWGNSTFELCKPEPGQYQIQLRTGATTTTRNMSLCVTDIPKFEQVQNMTHITCMTSSTFPLNISWMTGPSDANLKDSAMWQETNQDFQHFLDPERFCQRNVIVSRPLGDLHDHFVKCCVQNDAGNFCSEQIHIKIASAYSMVLVVACCVLGLAFVLVSFALVIIARKKKPGYERQLQMIQMLGPSDNDYTYIDFRDFKYEQKWEFPRENLEMGQELGAGAFGKVVQATAYGITKPGVSLQVAVKMLKEKHQAVEKEALMSELKMLTHIGHNINIVNLLGACTGTGPVYLIFQFCHYGDLLNYLKSNREHFYKSLTDAFNKDRFSSLYQNCQRKRNSRFYSKLFQSDDHSYVPMFLANKEQEALLSFTTSDVTEEILEDKEEEDLQTITYDDLLSFSYQVAKGMDFLSSKNCIHRDLAARNVLVTQGRLIKIGDFGLARDIENDSNYVVRGNARLPVKWMAPESIFKGMYTMKSDVWAYGILLWEIFSLGVTPYPGMKVDNTFYAMIERGFKMEQPYYAPESVYQVMCRCWALEPKDRPCFSKLVSFMEYQLTDVEQQLYCNVAVQQNGDSIYKNASVISQMAETGQEDAAEAAEKDQTSLPDSSSNSETTQTQSEETVQ
ncbi:receptor-type tyrosine-protein kinase FLT3 [Trichomycterus rosablanca]|uniref:receptor-type tyrosine-protein kinase FLT3 n=1 Tax=Trichomycterus rosablanca TaxID=2290929 RepID=UPI002F35C745